MYIGKNVTVGLGRSNKVNACKAHHLSTDTCSTHRHKVRNEPVAFRSKTPESGSVASTCMMCQVGRKGDKYIAPKCMTTDTSLGPKWYEDPSLSATSSGLQDMSLTNMFEKPIVTSMWACWQGTKNSKFSRADSGTLQEAPLVCCRHKTQPPNTVALCWLEGSREVVLSHVQELCGGPTTRHQAQTQHWLQVFLLCCSDQPTLIAQTSTTQHLSQPMLLC
jgi:hypothetical protein